MGVALSLQLAGLPETSCTPYDSCVEHRCQWLHYVCTEEALSELVAAWHGLAPEVRDEIVKIARGRGDSSPVGE
jgi:hypothetical protein